MSKIVSTLRGSLLRPVKLVDIFVVIVAVGYALALVFGMNVFPRDQEGILSLPFITQMFLPLVVAVLLSSWSFCPLFGKRGHEGFLLSVFGIGCAACSSGLLYSLSFLAFDQFGAKPFLQVNGGVLGWLIIAGFGGVSAVIVLVKLWWATLPITLSVHFVARCLRQREALQVTEQKKKPRR
ncbi:hypothetical protein [Pseudovibrio sp. FO-BEG1]|uniref:hypothetical protein n=1 Tax=Pseudovibrio sp. (strain FO-BEG1) TaxID=911045 RepID=UPI0005A08BCC|nr:hypothetical protein [Pseudovibrio sp. FO-BEG1]